MVRHRSDLCFGSGSRIPLGSAASTLSAITFLIMLLLCLSHAADCSAEQSVETGKKVTLQQDYGKLPLSFEVNQGQADGHVRFLSHGGGYTFLLTDRDAVLELREAFRPTGNLPERFGQRSQQRFTTNTIRMELIGAPTQQIFPRLKEPSIMLRVQLPFSSEAHFLRSLPLEQVHLCILPPVLLSEPITIHRSPARRSPLPLMHNQAIAVLFQPGT